MARGQQTKRDTQARETSEAAIHHPATYAFDVELADLISNSTRETSSRS